MTTSSRVSSAVTFSLTRERIDKAIEICWLTAIVLTVLTFQGRTLFLLFSQPKQNLLHLCALALVCLWVTDLALARASGAVPGRSGNWSWQFWRWAGRNPSRWLVIFLAGFTAAQVMATVFSPFPLISFFGRDLNDPGYELYSVLSYMVILAAISVRVRSIGPIRRLLLTVAVSGTMAAAYGASQHFGWDPIGYAAGAGRVWSSLGNPIFLASVLVMSVFATLAAYLLYERPSRSWWAVAASLAIGLQISAIWFSGSRGPLVATVVGAGAMSVTGLLLLQRRDVLRALVVGSVGLVLGVVIVLLPSPATTGGRSGLAIIGSILNQAASATGAEVDLSSSSLATDNVGNRVAIWQDAIDLLKTRETLEGSGATVKVLRHVFGFGPEMYYYSYSLAAKPRANFAVVSHAHDFALQIWLESGMFGIVSLIGITIAGALTVVRVGWKLKRGDLGAASGSIAVLTIGLVGIFTGRMIEQVVGVARVADLTIFWALIGLIVVVDRLAGDGVPETAEPTRRSAAAVRKPPKTDESYKLWAGAAIGLALLSVTLWIAYDGTALYASRLAAAGNNALNKGEVQKGYDEIKRASGIDKFSETYGLVSAQLERNSALSQTDPDQKLQILLSAYGTLAEYEQTNPWAVNNDVRLAWFVSAIADLGVSQAKGELWDRTRDLDFRMRPYPKVMAFVANSYVALGEFELGVEVADFAIEEAKPLGIEVPQAWWVKGEALGRLDKTTEALDSLEMAIEVAPDSQFAALSHRTLASYYDANGDPDLAKMHRDKADEIERAHALNGGG